MAPFCIYEPTPNYLLSGAWSSLLGHVSLHAILLKLGASSLHMWQPSMHGELFALPFVHWSYSSLDLAHYLPWHLPFGWYVQWWVLMRPPPCVFFGDTCHNTCLSHAKGLTLVLGAYPLSSSYIYLSFQRGLGWILIREAIVIVLDEIKLKSLE